MSSYITQSSLIDAINAYVNPRLSEALNLFALGYPSDAVFYLRRIKGFVVDLKNLLDSYHYPDVFKHLSDIDVHLFDIIYRSEFTTESIFRSARVFVWCQLLGKTPFYYVDIKPAVDSLKQLLVQGCTHE